MTQFNMKTICENYNTQSLARGANTIRKYTGRYLGLKIGDTVRMEYRKALDEPAFAVEYLTVASIAIADFESIINSHQYANHGDCSGLNEYREFFINLYGDVDGQFCAIYFG